MRRPEKDRRLPVKLLATRRGATLTFVGRLDRVPQLVADLLAMVADISPPLKVPHGNAVNARNKAAVTLKESGTRTATNNEGGHRP